MIDPAAQDLARLRKSPGVKVVEGPENRTMMVALDQSRDASPYVRGADGKPLAANPFKDARVREALFISVNRKGVYRGLANPTGTIITKLVNGWDATAAAVPQLDVSVSTGVHDGEAAVKAILCGAAAGEVCTAIHREGFDVIARMNEWIDAWAARHGITALDEFKGRCRYDRVL